MKLQTVALLSALGMSVSGTAAYFLAPTPTRAAVAEPVIGTDPEAKATDKPIGPLASSVDNATFSVGTTLTMEGHLGHARIEKGSTKSTYLLLEIRAATADTARSANHLAIVIDRSGSMKGDRLPNAIAAAISAVERLGDSDSVSVLAFDTTVKTIVPQTVVGSSGSFIRNEIKDKIRAITLGGDTCISCGIQEGLAELARSGDVADRMIVLSDGQPTAGERAPTMFELIGRQARDQGASITTIGVGTDYNEKILGAIALQSGGGHYFVENVSSLAGIFSKEAEKLRATVATKAKVDIKVAEGVTIDRVFDRAFQRTTLGVAVPLGNFSADDTLTVLLELHVPTDLEGEVPIASAKLSFEDRVKGGDGSCEGKLATFVTADPASVSELDPFVAARLARSKTAGVLQEVNDLLDRGQVDEAKAKLEAQEKALAETETRAQAAAPAPKREALKKDFDGQAGTISGVRQSLGKSGGGAADKSGVQKRNVEAMNPYML